jgi:rubrerythrin
VDPKSTADVLDMAIAEEEKAAKAYRDLAAAAEQDEVRDMLQKYGRQ